MQLKPGILQTVIGREVAFEIEAWLDIFPAFDWMISPTHPERQERLLYTRDQLLEEGLLICRRSENTALFGRNHDLQRAHIGVPSIARLITPGAPYFAGGCLVAADAVMSGEVKRAFALVRPPGHHAMRVVHGIRGFCTVNIEAVMVEYLRSVYGIRKIAVVDTDVHHGDGSQDIFYHDPDTLYISFHQDGRTLYPGTGFPDEAGSPAAWGTNINLPLLPGTGDEGLHRLYDGLIQHILDDFEPELIINSAGQDNHFSDPLASMAVTAQGYAKLADKLQADIAVLEGGYSVEAALPYVNTGIILAMADMDYSKVVEPDQSDLRQQDERCNKRVDQLIAETGELWRSRFSTRKELLAKCGNSWSRKKAFIMMKRDQRRTDRDRSLLQAMQRLSYDQDCGCGTRFGDQSAFIISLKRDTCSECRQTAYDEAQLENVMANGSMF
ncbi:MAG: histone deacetylase [Phascolarctobacterium faecium]